MKEYGAHGVGESDPFGELGKNPGDFIEKNLGLIIAVAKAKFGGAFSEEEVMSDAYMAWWAMKEYHNRHKNTKHTSSYTWFLSRQLDYSYEMGISLPLKRSKQFSTKDDADTPDQNDLLLDRASHSAFFEKNEAGALEKEEEFLYGDGFDDFEDTNGNGKGGRGEQHDKYTYVPKYIVCIESFNNCKPSKALTSILKAVSDKNARNNRRSYGKLLVAHRSVTRQADSIRKYLIYEASKAGYHLYVAICLNGSCNNILVAARSEEEAKQYLPAYGRLMEIRRMDFSGAF
jgi:hypothetical protein